MSAGKWLADFVGDAVTSIRHEWERSWFGREVTPTPTSSGERDVTQPGSERLGWDVPGSRAQSDATRNIDFGDWLSGDVSPIAPNPDVGLGHDRTSSAPAHEHDHDMDR